MRSVRNGDLAADVSREPGLQRSAEAVLGRLTFAALVLALLAGCDDGHKATGKRGGVATPVPKTLADGSRPASLPVALRRLRRRPAGGAHELSPGSRPPPPPRRAPHARAP